MEKKRVFITVDKEAWEGTQRILKQTNISNIFYNEILNDFIRTQYRLLQELQQKKDAGINVTFGDFLRMMGNIVDEQCAPQVKLF